MVPLGLSRLVCGTGFFFASAYSVTFLHQLGGASLAMPPIYAGS